MSKTSDHNEARSGSDVPVLLTRNQVIRLTIHSLAAGGEGVSKDFGRPIFVNRTAPGDVVDVQLYDVRKEFARGHVVSIIEKSAARTEPPCKLFKVCGGCQWQHLLYERQLEYKRDIICQALKHIGKLDSECVRPALGADAPLYYRNKVQFPVDSVKGTGRILAGYYEQNSHELVNIKHCPVQPEPLDRCLAAIKEALERFGFSTYDERTHVGLIRHIALRYSFGFNQILATVVVNSGSEARVRADWERKMQKVAAEVMQKVGEVVGFCVNFNDFRGNRIMGNSTICLSGHPHIVEKLSTHLPSAPQQLHDGIRFRLSTSSFFQVNSHQAEVLLDQVLLATCPALADEAPNTAAAEVSVLIDAYAGVGTMALWLASVAKRIIAIEEAGASVQDGLENLEINGIANVEFVEAKVEDVIPDLLQTGLQADVVVVDPPRKGIDPVGLEAIVELGAARIVYVSCNPATLARDLRKLTDSGYEILYIQPVDMFPQTFHVESVTVLQKVGS